MEWIVFAAIGVVLVAVLAGRAFSRRGRGEAVTGKRADASSGGWWPWAFWGAGDSGASDSSRGGVEPGPGPDPSPSPDVGDFGGSGGGDFGGGGDGGGAG